MIRPATLEDEEWVGRIFRGEDHILGKGFFGTIWYRYWNNSISNERWDVIPQVAFAHYKLRKDGWKVVYEIAVASNEKRKGYARLFMDHIGKPCELKTDADHKESNAFYKACGFLPSGEKHSRDGKKRLRIWTCAQ